MDIHETIKDIKGQFRLFMNGVASQSMREKGLEYKLNFGIELPRLKEIAACYEKNHEVAQTLWKENIRECKILAGMLQPVDTFYPEIADIWVEDMRYPEIVELTCMTLFQHLPYASDKSFEWMADEREYVQLCGFMLMARLLMNGNLLVERSEAEFLDQAIATLQSEGILTQKAAATALKKFALQSRENSKKLNRLLAPLAKSDKEKVAFWVEDIKLETESWR
ncbi:MAG: DNA alkylation repair protein [Phocaeicola sp.]|uniref:DNA alkylation repair protein n=1 Tax=Phocaeicola sp. TaxID=2773926 RepID=UPI0023CE1769|nr:DNA alkylation repair protein [Phocaeicola sp.]MDE5676354.1 DNA alkylation repair protein [Phocaeicola sp.]MDE6180434.1 DNA alkylation repair protein [Phocaeicola sp.]